MLFRLHAFFFVTPLLGLLFYPIPSLLDNRVVRSLTRSEDRTQRLACCIHLQPSSVIEHVRTRLCRLFVLYACGAMALARRCMCARVYRYPRRTVTHWPPSQMCSRTGGLCERDVCIAVLDTKSGRAEALDLGSRSLMHVDTFTVYPAYLTGSVDPWCYFSASSLSGVVR